MWYRFNKGEIRGKLKVKKTQVCWYDMEYNGDCFDEDFTIPGENEIETLNRIGQLLPYVSTVDNMGDSGDISRVFIHMDDGSVYELLMKKLSKEEFAECNNFYGGKEVIA